MKHKVKIIILSALGVLLVGSSVVYAYSQKGTLISQKTEELPDGNIYVEENRKCRSKSCRFGISSRRSRSGNERISALDGENSVKDNSCKKLF